MTIPPERPRLQKRFVTARDVRDMASAGVRQVSDSDDLVLTHAARELANELGFRVAKRADVVFYQHVSDGTTRASSEKPHPAAAASIDRPTTMSMSRNSLAGDVSHHEDVVEAITSVFQEADNHSPTPAEVREVTYRVLKARSKP